MITWEGDESVALQGHEEDIAHEVAGCLAHTVAGGGIPNIVLTTVKHTKILATESLQKSMAVDPHFFANSDPAVFSLCRSGSRCFFNADPDPA